MFIITAMIIKDDKEFRVSETVFQFLQEIRQIVGTGLFLSFKNTYNTRMGKIKFF